MLAACRVGLPPSCEHPLPSRRGSGFLNPETRGQLLPLSPCPSGCHKARPLPCPSCLAPGPLLTCFTWPSAGQPGHGLQEGSPSRRPDPAGRRVAVPHWPLLALQRGSSRRLGLAGGPAVRLTPCLLSRGPAAAPVPCSAGPGLRQHHSGLGIHSPLWAAASLELPTPLWSLYMLPEETVSTA